jgi:hypothetical protein
MNKPISASLGLKIFLGKHIRREVFREFFPSRCPEKRLVYSDERLRQSASQMRERILAK